MNGENLMNSINDYLLVESDDKVLDATVQFLQEANVIKYDKKTLRKRLFSQATLMAAREAGDPLYVKYMKATKQRKEYRHKIQVKYASKGKAKLREYEARRKAKKSSK